MMTSVRAVLFDFDGTLADTAPDLAEAANRLRSEQGLERMDEAALRAVASQGARGLLRVALGVVPGDADFESLRSRYLALYDHCFDARTRLFGGVEPLLEGLQQRGIVWGIVTNKPRRFAAPLVAALGLRPTRGCLVTPDELRAAKPDPEGIHRALEQLGVASSEALYVGDDLRDAQAAAAAGCAMAAAAYGYIADEDPASWNAACVIGSPLELLDCLPGHAPVTPT